MMTCGEIQKGLSLYLDGQLTAEARAATDEHLEFCPLCRQQLSETRAIIRGLAMIKRPAPPLDLAATISDALMIERAARANIPSPPIVIRLVRWLEPHLMPYSIGAFASVLLFISLLGALRPYMMTLRDLQNAANAHEEVSVWVGEDGEFDVTRPISLEGYAASRTRYAAESPSLNPRGALAALAWAPASGSDDDDDMVVVADVYGNGRASLAGVVQPPRNPRMLDEFQDALRKTPAFVPAALDRRPETMRVVFVMQKVNVQESSF